MKFKFLLILILILLPILNTSAANLIEVYFFYQESCPYCAQAQTWLSEMENQYANLKIRRFEVSQNSMNTQLFTLMAEKYGGMAQSLPTFFIDYYMVEGFDESIQTGLEKKIQECLVQPCISPAESLKSNNVNVINDSQVIPAENRTSNIIIGSIIIISALGLIVWGGVKIVKKIKKRRM